VGPDGRVEDAEALVAAVGGRAPVDRVTPLRYEAPLAPPVAARLENRPLEWSGLIAAVETACAAWAEAGAELMIVEGVGGFLCPLTADRTVADLAVHFDYPVLIVARRGLGTLNHTLLTAEAIRVRDLRLAGVVLNGAEATVCERAESTNPAALAERLGNAPILAEIRHQSRPGPLDGEGLALIQWMDHVARPRGVAGAGPLPSRS
jgi:dethiobiotin synthetase